MEYGDSQREITDLSFEIDIHRSSIPVLVAFWAEWSGGCHIMLPILESLAESLAGRVAVVRMNIDQSPRTAEKYGVHKVPTLLLFRHGELVESIFGSLPRSELAKRVERNLDNEQVM